MYFSAKKENRIKVKKQLKEEEQEGITKKLSSLP